MVEYSKCIYRAETPFIKVLRHRKHKNAISNMSVDIQSMSGEDNKRSSEAFSGTRVEVGYLGGVINEVLFFIYS